VGELLDGRYLLEETIGQGGMGVVHRAHDQALGRTVAIKIFRESAGDAARTTSETRLLASLNHVSLVTLFDARIQEGQPSFLVMEYVEGPTLAERIQSGPVAADEVATMARDLAEALHVVHGAGVVHRDIKPSNVLLRPSPLPGGQYRAKLADFGIAYLVDSTRLTVPGALIGTAAYLSPEQVRGAEPAPASDIYALGLVLVEALTGRRAFPQTGTHEAALARLTMDPEVPGAFGYPWRSLLTRMTARDPEQRPTALEVMVAARTLDAPADEATVSTGMLETGLLATDPVDPGPVDTDLAATDPADTGALDPDPVPTGALGSGSAGSGAVDSGSAAPSANANATATATAGDGPQPTLVMKSARLATPPPTAVLQKAATADAARADGLATEIMPAGAGAGAAASGVAPAGAAPQTATATVAAPGAGTAPVASSAAPKRSRRAVLLVLVLVAVVVIAVVVGVLLWLLGASAPPAAPALPPLEDPLGTHLQQLMDEVTP
jgi:hypothetical protein